MYVCATLSTPVAAALVMKGMSPGAALVMLMAGPATNVTTISMVVGILGKRSLGIYIGSIVVCSLFMAFITDLIYRVIGVSAVASAGFTSTARGLLGVVRVGRSANLGRTDSAIIMARTI